HVVAVVEQEAAEHGVGPALGLGHHGQVEEHHHAHESSRGLAHGGDIEVRLQLHLKAVLVQAYQCRQFQRL
ncbi:hypothetical protein ABXW85_23715, partial [Streptococcus suis]